MALFELLAGGFGGVVGGTPGGLGTRGIDFPTTGVPKLGSPGGLRVPSGPGGLLPFAPPRVVGSEQLHALNAARSAMNTFDLMGTQDYPAGGYGTWGTYGGYSPPASWADVALGVGRTIGDLVLAHNAPSGGGGGGGGGAMPAQYTNGGNGGCCAPRSTLPMATIVEDPCGGSPAVYRKVGKVSSGLFPGDFSAHKRVNRLAQKARRPVRRARKR